MRVHFGRPSILLLAGVMALTPAIKLCAQSQETASLTGTVTDSSGAVVPGATIELANPSTGKTYKAVSNSLGSYNIADITPGPGYKETVTANGFRTSELTGLYLNVGTTRSQNVKLTVGAVAETVIGGFMHSPSSNRDQGQPILADGQDVASRQGLVLPLI